MILSIFGPEIGQAAAALRCLAKVNQSLRNRDKLKDDVISQLSDQLVALSVRLQELERRQKLI